MDPVLPAPAELGAAGIPRRRGTGTCTSFTTRGRNVKGGERTERTVSTPVRSAMAREESLPAAVAGARTPSARATSRIRPRRGPDPPGRPHPRPGQGRPGRPDPDDCPLPQLPRHQDLRHHCRAPAPRAAESREKPPRGHARGLAVKGNLQPVHVPSDQPWRLPRLPYSDRLGSPRAGSVGGLGQGVQEAPQGARELLVQVAELAVRRLVPDYVGARRRQAGHQPGVVPLTTKSLSRTRERHMTWAYPGQWHHCPGSEVSSPGTTCKGR